MKSKIFTSAILLFSLVTFVATSSHAQSVCTDPVGFTTLSISSSSAELEWQRVTQEGSSTPRKYTVRYRVVGTTAWTKFTVKAHANDLVVNTSLINLAPLTTYQWQVRGICTNGSKTAFLAGPNFTTLAQREHENTSPVLANNLIAQVYPTVVQNAISIVGQIRSAGEVTISVTNITGQTVIQRSLFLDAGEFITAVDLTGLSSGYYIVAIKNGNERIATKIEKQ